MNNVFEQLINTPEKAVKHFDLVYVDDTKLSIIRKKHGRGFIYKMSGKPINKSKHLKRIKELMIPPAWVDVRITPFSNGHLQAIGKDEKQRKQYLYHENWNIIRNQTKFYKMTAFGKALPAIRQKIKKDLEQDEWTKSKVIALVIKLMEETHIRIGNEYYAKRNKSYGLSTLRKRHVNIHKDKVKFEFTGKKGKQHSITVRNKKLVKLINSCEEIPGWELFKFYSKDGDKKAIDSSMINQYLLEVTDDYYTAKDFRTWSASVIFLESLIDLDSSKDEKEIKSNLLTAYDIAAKALGNTRSVCRDYYVHPILPKKYEDGTLKKSFHKIKNNANQIKYLSATETEMLRIIKSYRPQLEDTDT